MIAVQKSGEPGADGANFWIRGISTFGSGQSPLLILDGVEITTQMLNNIPPETIESFSVLQGRHGHGPLRFARRQRRDDHHHQERP